MFALTYRPAVEGGWILVARSGGVVVLEPAAIGLVDPIREALGGTDAVEAIIGVLTGNGFARTPAFALVQMTGEDLRVIVRGRLDLEVADPGGRHTVSGSGISTWTERGFTSVSSAALTVADARQLDGVAPLVLESGEAVVSSISLTAGIAAGSDPPVSEVTVAAIPDESVTTDAGDTVLRPKSEPTDVLEHDGTAASELELPVAVPPPNTSREAAVGEPSATDPGPAPDTVASLPDDATVAPAQSDDVSRLGDHDGDTVLNSDLPRRRGERPTPAPTGGDTAIPRLQLSSGAVEALDRPILVGRAPSVSKVSGGRMPRLVTIGTADHDISRNHAQFTLEGGTVVVTDLHSRNGTLVVLPGKGPQKLRAGEPTAVIVGTVVDFGGGVTMTVRED